MMSTSSIGAQIYETAGATPPDWGSLRRQTRRHRQRRQASQTVLGEHQDAIVAAELSGCDTPGNGAGGNAFTGLARRRPTNSPQQRGSGPN